MLISKSVPSTSCPGAAGNKEQDDDCKWVLDRVGCVCLLMCRGWKRVAGRREIVVDYID